MQKNRAKISLVIITKNEAKNIERCIQSVSFADEVIVVDSGSTDSTVDIARKLGAKVFIEEWPGYFLQKKKATSYAKYEWVLSLDADEALSPELHAEIEKLLYLSRKDDYDAYSLPRKSFHLGRWICHGGWFPDRQVRLFQKQRAEWQGGEVHEHVHAQRMGRLHQPILHWVFEDLSDQVDTNNKYSTLGALDLLKKKKRPSLSKLIVKPIFKFLEVYFVKKGFLDGMPGFIIAVGAAYSMFLKYAKLWESVHVTSQTRSES